MNVPALPSLAGVQQIGIMQELLAVLTTNVRSLIYFSFQTADFQKALHIYKLDDIVRNKPNPECQTLREDGDIKFFRVYQPDGDTRCALLVYRANKQVSLSLVADLYGY